MKKVYLIPVILITFIIVIVSYDCYHRHQQALTIEKPAVSEPVPLR